VEGLLNTENLIALLTLTALEIVLGIDNIVFISIVAGKLPVAQQPQARRLGLAAAMVMRILLLLSISWVIGLEEDLFSLPVLDQGISGRDLILIAGGLFLLGKSTYEIHEKLEGETGHASRKVPPSFAGVIVQIMLLDIVFSLDSVITAVGMARDIWVMIAAVVIAVAIMLVASGPISRFVDEHPTVKMLALSFLLLIGTSLFADGLGLHIPKGYIYAAMAFSVLVEALNLLATRRREPVTLHQGYVADGADRRPGDGRPRPPGEPAVTAAGTAAPTASASASPPGGARAPQPGRSGGSPARSGSRTRRGRRG
jgi:predicted tellurium resistance membrane protein TerC